jgi:hypothetical protein
MKTCTLKHKSGYKKEIQERRKNAFNLFIKKSNANKSKGMGCSSTNDGVGKINEMDKASNNDDDVDKTKETGCSCNWCK